MAKKAISLTLILLHLAVGIQPVHGEYERTYFHYYQLAVSAFNCENYDEALFFLKTAHAIDPEQKRPLQFINLIKRIKENRMAAASSEVAGIQRSFQKDEKRAVKTHRPDFLLQQSPPPTKRKPPLQFLAFPMPRKMPAKTVVPSESRRMAAVSPSDSTEPPREPIAEIFRREESRREFEPSVPPPMLHFRKEEVVELDEALRVLQPNTTVEIEIGKSIILRGRSITRALAVNEGFVETARINKDQLTVKAVRRGSTFLHVWDDRGRWTFHVKCVYPFESEQREVDATRGMEYARPFSVAYSDHWSSYYRGQDVPGLARRNLTFTQWAGIFGETPYGAVDASAHSFKFDESTEIVGQTIGVTDAHIGPFRDFSIRGYDARKNFSELTLPSRYFRGVLIDAYAFRRNLAYSYFKGQDESTTFFFPASGSSRIQKAFLEGLRLTVFPEETPQYSLNVAQGYGRGRRDNLKDKVFSIETRQRFRDVNLHGELAHDEDVYAFLGRSGLKKDNYAVHFSLRDINKGFTTITGAPSGQGEVGGLFNFEWKPEAFTLGGSLDVFRNRQIPNPLDDNSLNVDFNSSVTFPAGLNAQWGSSFSYVNTRQMLSPREYIALSNNYSRSYKVGKSRYLTLSAGNSYQQSRFSQSQFSDYNRYGMRAGLRTGLIKNLSYFLNYEYFWARDIFLKSSSNPTTLSTGLSYHLNPTDSLSLGLDVNYRNEEDAEGNFSFLAGEDSVGGGLNVTYRPAPNFEIFMDGQLRSVWSEIRGNPSYNDADIRFGVRSNWDLPVRWNPTGAIRGVVYKDFDGNGLQGRNEPGIPGIRVRAGRQETITNDHGEYTIEVSAKKARIGLDINTVPAGFVFSTALTRDVAIRHQKTVQVNFGLTARSGVYGVVYYDENENGKPDRGDQFFSNVVLRLDGEEITKTDFSGSYFFENITPGKHTVRIDINSIPIEYSPIIKMESAVVVKEGMTHVHNVPLRKNGR